MKISVIRDAINRTRETRLIASVQDLQASWELLIRKLWQERWRNRPPEAIAI
ncbi:hypothetical protein [Nostoc sp. FACHB-133]|uniref:hypothetical protein n=1 Tax=Nostoc sp. FACHB-133 TaxID=2692835 RepID=UPI00168725BB|nr:hypothetical protein [Nostoc sp. FACHB-133]MBD2526147.1 hypothetical protein [Nostoc sp. FACHB-133]